MSNLARLYQDGELKIFHNVGYPKQNHSHFRSIEIWERVAMSVKAEPVDG